jgi:hypothetical protein
MNGNVPRRRPPHEVQHAVVGPGAARVDPRPKKKTFQPLFSWLVLDPEVKDVSEGGIVMPDGVAPPDRGLVAKVLAAGPECKWVREGDTVITGGKTMGVAIAYGGSAQVLCVQEELIVGVVAHDGRVLTGPAVAPEKSHAVPPPAGA